MKTAEVYYIGVKASDLGDQGIKVLLTTSQTFIKNHINAASVKLSAGCVSQTLTISVFVVDYRNTASKQVVSDIVAGNSALLIVTPTNTHNRWQIAIGYCRVSGSRSYHKYI